VFQAFFVSYLVEPGYGEKFKIFQELLDSSVNYGFSALAEIGMTTMEYSDHLQFPLTSRVECFNLKTCLMQMVTDGEFATISAPEYSKYISNKLGYQDEITFPCSLDENFISENIVAPFTKGNPLVNQFNKIL
jgi:hypothetical protein